MTDMFVDIVKNSDKVKAIEDTCVAQTDRPQQLVRKARTEVEERQLMLPQH